MTITATFHKTGQDGVYLAVHPATGRERLAVVYDCGQRIDWPLVTRRGLRFENDVIPSYLRLAAEITARHLMRQGHCSVDSIEQQLALAQFRAARCSDQRAARSERFDLEMIGHDRLAYMPHHAIIISYALDRLGSEQ